jgi:hypothetical protein
MNNSVLGLIFASCVFSSCLEPTQITLSFESDLPCNQLTGLSLSVGASNVFDTAPSKSALSGFTCSEGTPNSSLGTLTLVPGNAAKDSSVGIALYLAKVGATASGDGHACKKGQPNCIFLPVIFKFIPNTTLTATLVLRNSCDAKVCSTGLACFANAACLGSTIPSSDCGADTCALTIPEENTVRIDAGIDSGIPDVDAGVDAGRADSGIDAGQFDAGSIDAGSFDAGIYHWTQVTPAPLIRYFSSMAFDSSRGATLIFGGVIGTRSLSDLWEWNGTKWNQLETGVSPPARFGHSMAYDSNEKKTVVFGGRRLDAVRAANLSDTWELKSQSDGGIVWRELQFLSRAPVGRSRHSMAFDSARNRMVLFGGIEIFPDGGSNLLQDTWELTDGGWVQMFPDGGLVDGGTLIPPARYLHSMAFDKVQNRTVMFGGHGFRREFFSWNGASWTLYQTLLDPEPRIGNTIAFDSSRNTLVLFGGRNEVGNYLSDAYQLNGNEWQAIAVQAPTALYASSMAYDSVRNQLVLFGGFNGQATQETWTLKNDAGVSTWNQKTFNGPSERNGHSMAYDPVRKRVVLFGGRDDSNVFLGDTWEWNGTHWVSVNSSGPARAFSSIAFDSQSLVLFGGADDAGIQGDTWTLGDGGVWLAVSSGPEARRSHQMVFDSTQNAVMVFGGVGPDAGQIDDSWSRSPNGVWKIGSKATPLGRYNHAMAFDSNRGVGVIFGGVSNVPSIEFADTWIGSASTDAGWQKLPFAVNPSPRSGHAMAYDSFKRNVIFFGGTSAGLVQNDTWQFDGTSWRPLDIPGPISRAYAPMAYDANRGVMVLFGGTSNLGSLQDTWEYGP